jgi:hypothetical protein
MHLIQMLLPLVRGDGQAVEDALFAQTRAELVAEFQGATAYLRSPALGAWTAPDGRVERDQMVMVEVVAPTFDRPWWDAYAARLAERFTQEEMHIRAIPVETL